MVYMNEITNLIDQMMRVDIFRPSEKLRMLKDDEKTFLDPNLIMDARHRILREDLSISPTKCSVFMEAKRLLTQEEARDLHMKKQQRFLERELKKFEMELCKSRPKFSRPYVCKKRILAPSDDEEFWRMSRIRKNKVDGSFSADTIQKATITELQDTFSKLEDTKEFLEPEVPQVGSIKVTIKDKPNYESDTQRLRVLRRCFDALKANAEEEQRLRDIKTRIQQNVATRIMKKYFDLWRTRMKSDESDSKEQKEQKENRKITEEQKIEMFINAITERQKELMKTPKSRMKNGSSVEQQPKEAETKKSVFCKRVVVESPAQSRLNAQKQIIEKQRAKLAEQNRIIEELKLKQAQNAIFKSSKETMDMAKETISHCGQKTRRTLIQLMQQAGYRDKSLTVPQKAPDPPKFLLRMEARAEARKERLKLAEDSRRKKFEEEKRKEEAARLEEEHEKRRLQQEALIEARRLRREQEQKRLREIEKIKTLNAMADEFHRKYLLRNYIMEPLVALVEEKKNNMQRADDRYRKYLIRKVFTTWKRETENRYKIKAEIAESSYNRNLMTRVFVEWKQMVREENLKYQVAVDFCDMKLLDKYFKQWQIITIELKARYQEKLNLADSHYASKLKVRYFCTWKKYLTIAADIKESEKRKDELRQLVQQVIPDFDPKQRGVALED